MKLLVLDGGMRLGNTWKLAMHVKQELLALSQDIEFEEIHLKDMELPYCLGCSNCFRKGHRSCPHNKIVQSILDKIEACDGLIFAAPTYYMQLPALAKNLIDHLSYLFHRPRYFNKIGMVITTTGAVGAKDMTKYLAGALVGWGFNRCYQLPVAAVSWNAYIPSEKDKRKAAAIAKRFYKTIADRKLLPPSLATVFGFNLVRGISTNYGKGAEYETQDGIFWAQEGYAKVCFAPSVPLSLFKKLIGTVSYLLGKKLSKILVVTYKK